MTTCRIHQINLVSRERVCIQNRQKYRSNVIHDNHALNHSSYKHELVLFVAIYIWFGICRFAVRPNSLHGQRDSVLYANVYNALTATAIATHIQQSIHSFIVRERERAPECVCVSKQQLVYSTPFIAHHCYSSTATSLETLSNRYFDVEVHYSSALFALRWCCLIRIHGKIASFQILCKLKQQIRFLNDTKLFVIQTFVVQLNL